MGSKWPAIGPNGDEFITNGGQICWEAQLLCRFAQLANRAGLLIPQDSQRLREELEGWARLDDKYETRLVNAEDSWIPGDLLPLAALAQHHEMSTRLLDWTGNPFVAAYFAAADAKFVHRASTHICVWALLPYLLDSAPSSGGARRLTSVVTPHAGNPNMHAQHGMFLVDRPYGVNLDAPVDRTPWDVLAAQQLLRHNVKDVEGALTKLVLPTTAAGELLKRLRGLNVSASTVFPGYVGVARAVKEEAEI